MTKKQEKAGGHDALWFEDALELSDVIEALDALLEHGVKHLPPGMSRAFERDDYAAALAIARDHYSALLSDARRGSLREASIIYIVLLTYRALHEEATNILRKSMTQHAQDVSLQLTQVLSLMEQERTDTARELLDGLGHVQITRGRLLALMGHVYLELGDIDESIGCYKRALEKGSKDVDVAYRLSRLLWELGEGEEDLTARHDSAHYLERAARLALREARLWSLTGQAWAELGEWGRAVDAFSRVVKLEEDDEEAWLDYGESLRARGELPAAAKAFERASKLDPFHTVARLELAYTLHLQGFFEEAVQAYARILKDHPGNLEALQGAAMSNFEQGDFEAARRAAAQVIEGAPELAEGHYNMGMIELELCDQAGALRSLDRAVELAPDHGGYRLRRLLASLQRGGDSATTPLTRLVHEAMAHGGELGELLEVLMRLLQLGYNQEVRELLEWYDPYGEELADVDWLVTTPLLWLILLFESTGGAGDYGEEPLEESEAARLEALCLARLDRFEEELPVMVDIEPIEQLSRRLPLEAAQRVERLCDRLLGC